MAESDNVLTKLHELMLYIIPQLGKFPSNRKLVLWNCIQIRLPAPSASLLIVLLSCTLCRAEVGAGFSPMFSVDTRWGFGTSENVSGLFRVDTRFSGSIGEGDSGLFTLDTRGVLSGSASITGWVTDDRGIALPGARVAALQSGVVRCQTASDSAGAYALSSLPEGTYQAQAAMDGYLTVNSYGLSLGPNQTLVQNFSLPSKPAAPIVVSTNRAVQGVTLVAVTNAQLRAFVGGVFVTNFTLDLSKPTAVITHGWNSAATDWPTDMAASLVVGGIANVNLLAWDWEAARTGYLPPLLRLTQAFDAAPREGRKLGQALAGMLGSTYGQPIHFIGHSLGTLVNAGAANYLHKGGAFAPANTQMTLLDDAALANVAGGVVQLTYTIPGVYSPYQLGLSFPCGWVSPIPEATVGWIDNYMSLVGGYHAEAVNTFLEKGPDFTDKSNPFAFLADVHGYAYRWYAKSAANPNQPSLLLGNRYSFERLGNSAVFPSPNPYPLGSFFAQDLGSSQEMALMQLQTEDEINTVLKRQAAAFTGFGLQSSVNFAKGVAQTIGSVGLDVAMSLIPHTPSGTAVYTGTADSSAAYYMESPVQTTPMWSFQVNLQTQPASSSSLQSSAGTAGRLSGPELGPGEAANQQAGIWIPIQIPSNAAILSFDFALQGDPVDDFLTADIDGTNVFALEGRFMPANSPLNSGPVDVSPWAGRSVELFLGLVGGTSTNASVTVDGMRFYSVSAPLLSAQVSQNTVVVQWPISASGYVLEATDDVTNLGAWKPVPDVPTIVDFQYTVTNQVVGGGRFYRLRQ